MTKDGDVISSPDIVMGMVANGGAEGLMSIPISSCTLVSRDEHGNDICGIGGTCTVANVQALGQNKTNIRYYLILDSEFIQNPKCQKINFYNTKIVEKHYFMGSVSRWH